MCYGQGVRILLSVKISLLACVMLQKNRSHHRSNWLTNKEGLVEFGTSEYLTQRNLELKDSVLHSGAWPLRI